HLVDLVGAAGERAADHQKDPFGAEPPGFLGDAFGGRPAEEHRLHLPEDDLSRAQHGPAPPRLRRSRYRNLLGRIKVRHICATGLWSKPRPSSGCRKLRPITSVNSSSSTTTSGSKE